MGLPPSNYNNSSLVSTPYQNSSSVHSHSKKQFYSLNPTILLRPTLIRKIKKKGSQQSAVVAESLETSDFRPFGAYYLSFRDIKTTVSTCGVCGNISTQHTFSATYPFISSNRKSCTKLLGLQET